MNKNLILNPAKNEDLKIINELMHNSKKYWGYDDDFMNKFMDIFQLTKNYLETNHTWLLYKNNKLIGFYSLSMTPDNQLELDNFFIALDYIGKGFGKILWDHVIDTARHLEKNEFILWSDPGADGFYKKMGCIKIGIKKSPMMPDRSPAVFKYTI